MKKIQKFQLSMVLIFRMEKKEGRLAIFFQTLFMFGDGQHGEGYGKIMITKCHFGQNGSLRMNGKKSFQIFLLEDIKRKYLMIYEKK